MTAPSKTGSSHLEGYERSQHMTERLMAVSTKPFAHLRLPLQSRPASLPRRLRATRRSQAGLRARSTIPQR